jgi:hypothetical protein
MKLADLAIKCAIFAVLIMMGYTMTLMVKALQERASIIARLDVIEERMNAQARAVGNLQYYEAYKIGEPKYDETVLPERKRK